MSSEGDFVFGLILGVFILMGLLGFLFIFHTYPWIGETNAEFFCESRGMVVKDFEQDAGHLVFVECEESPIVVKSGFYWQRDLK